MSSTYEDTLKNIASNLGMNDDSDQPNNNTYSSEFFKEHLNPKLLTAAGLLKLAWDGFQLMLDYFNKEMQEKYKSTDRLNVYNSLYKFLQSPRSQFDELRSTIDGKMFDEIMADIRIILMDAIDIINGEFKKLKSLPDSFIEDLRELNTAFDCKARRILADYKFYSLYDIKLIFKDKTKFNHWIDSLTKLVDNKDEHDALNKLMELVQRTMREFKRNKSQDT